MRIEGGYLYCDRDEAKRIVVHQMVGDEYQLSVVGVDGQLTPHGPWLKIQPYRGAKYDPVEGFILRRPVSLCSPELLAHVQPTESIHFL